MSVEIWPPIAPEALKLATETAQKRELDWLLQDLYGMLIDFKHGLEGCYALLAPIDPGSTLVLSTPRNELVKGYITRVGTRIVKGTIQLRMRTLPPQTLTINPDHPIHLAPLTSLHALLTHLVDLLGLTLSYAYPDAHPDAARSPSQSYHHHHQARPSSAHSPPRPSESPASPHFLAAQLRLLAQSLAEASALLKGPPLTSADPAWTARSAASAHFLQPPLAPPQGAQQQLASLFSLPHHAGGGASSGSNNNNNSNNSNNNNNNGNNSNGNNSNSNNSNSSNPPLSTSSIHGGSSSGTASGRASHDAATRPGSASGAAAAPTPPPLSFYLGLQDSSLVLWLRTLEAADAPVNFGTKLALAIGTARRLEHDEADRVFAFRCRGDGADELDRDHHGGGGGGGGKATTTTRPDRSNPAISNRASSSSLRRGHAPANKNNNNSNASSGGGGGGSTSSTGSSSPAVEVLVREKVRVETQDPSLLSLSAKLSALGHALGHARRNLAAVMGEPVAGISGGGGSGGDENDNDEQEEKDEKAVGY